MGGSKFGVIRRDMLALRDEPAHPETGETQRNRIGWSVVGQDLVERQRDKAHSDRRE
jgi:hypothetical protein